MPAYILSTDSTADLPWSYYTENNVPYLWLTFTLDNKEYADNGDCKLSSRQFYDLVRQGKMPVTAQINSASFIAHVEPMLQKGLDVLHIAFSSGLSGTYDSCYLGAKEMAEKYPDRKVIVVDSRCASLGEGLLVYYAVQNRDKGMSIEESADWLEKNKLNLCHWFTVDDLFHLHRGGRVSKSSAILGSLLGVKPVLHVDDEGHLILREKVRGRTAAIKRLMEKMQQTATNAKGQIVFISHGDCKEEAEQLAALIEKELGVTKFVINPVGPVIGTHSGPGTIALFFIGSKR